MEMMVGVDVGCLLPSAKVLGVPGLKFGAISCTPVKSGGGREIDRFLRAAKAREVRCKMQANCRSWEGTTNDAVA